MSADKPKSGWLSSAAFSIACCTRLPASDDRRREKGIGAASVTTEGQLASLPHQMQTIFVGLASRALVAARRSLSSEASLRDTLTKALEATTVSVEDVSGGCGAMFKIFVESPKFKGLSTVKQHRLVNDVLKEEIKEMHGLTIFTRPSP